MANPSRLGEFELIDKIAKMFGPSPENELWSGDDCAVLRIGDQTVLLTIDTVVESVDFDFAYASSEDVGWKALSVNASDIAAMGGRPTRAVASVCLSTGNAEDVALGIGSGMAGAATELGLGIAGGDLSEATETSVTVAMLGESDDQPVTRSGARVGDAICVTGTLGGAAAGLVALREGRGEEFPTLAARQLRPRARVREGLAIAGAGASAMIDLSDGLAADLTHIVLDNDLGCAVDADRIPVEPALVEGAETLQLTALDTAIIGGEDYELLFCAAPSAVTSLETQIGATGVTVIGEVTEGPALIGEVPLEEWKERSWEHFQR